MSKSAHYKWGIMAGLILSWTNLTQAATGRPNILFCLADDPEYCEVLFRLRQQLHDRLEELKDPRAKDPDYREFDKHPYLGGFGGMRNKK